MYKLERLRYSLFCIEICRSLIGINTYKPGEINDFSRTLSSSAEVRTLAYRSGDENLINLFETGQDVYIYTAKSMLGEDKWNKFDKSEKKGWRKKFKVVFLAVAYRMSAKTLGQSLNVPEYEAQGYVDALFAQFPVLEKFILENAGYPIGHEGYVNTELGDTLRVSAYRYLWTDDKWHPGKKRQDGRVIAKLNSAGINYRIQSFSAIALASGFANVVQESAKKDMLLRNIIVVHDSCENYVSINYLFDIRKFYDENFHKYCKEKYGISFNYDLELGLDYANMLGINVVTHGKEIEVTGSGSNILKLLWKIENESDLKVSIDRPIEEIVPKMEPDAMSRFILEEQCCMDHDYSNYTVKITKTD